jgi:hypothetical protein
MQGGTHEVAYFSRSCALEGSLSVIVEIHSGYSSILLILGASFSFIKLMGTSSPTAQPDRVLSGAVFADALLLAVAHALASISTYDNPTIMISTGAIYVSVPRS